MTERPILFSAPMVRAILDGSKTQTRRVVKGGRRDSDIRLVDIERNQPGGIQNHEELGKCFQWVSEGGFGYGYSNCPYGQPGDRLWVRETWVGKNWGYDRPERVIYRASDDSYGNPRETTTHPDVKWKPSIHMPRWASRITLELTDVRVQRLREISEADAKAEGVAEDKSACDHVRRSCDSVGCLGPGYRAAFAELWDSINGKRSGCAWADNPWVWALTFRRIKP